MPRTIIGTPIKHDDAIPALNDFQRGIAPVFYEESIGFSISVLKKFIADAEAELKKLRPNQADDYCIVFMPMIDNSGVSPKLTALLTPAFYVANPTYNGNFKHQFTKTLHPIPPELLASDPEDPYDPYDPNNPPIDALNHGQGAPLILPSSSFVSTSKKRKQATGKKK